MTIDEIINEYAREYSPYMSGLVNHLPMGQLALYKMGNDIQQVKSYSKAYVERGKIDPVKKEYNSVESIRECLGKRDQYEGCRDLMMTEMLSKGAEDLIREVVNTYPLGMSSGLFHTIIRLAYSVEGMALEPGLKEEVARALAYYVTAYRAGEKFTRKVSATEFNQEVKALFQDSHIKKLIDSQATRGKQMRALYEDQTYLEKAPLIDGNSRDKISTLLELLLPLLDQTNNIVILHCITGLHGLVVLEKSFDNFDQALDIMTACIITHLLTVKDLNIDIKQEQMPEKEWDQLIKKASRSSDVHTIKFVYSASQLYQKYQLPSLNQSAYQRIKAK